MFREVCCNKLLYCLDSGRFRKWAGSFHGRAPPGRRTSLMPCGRSTTRHRHHRLHRPPHHRKPLPPLATRLASSPLRSATSLTDAAFSSPFLRRLAFLSGADAAAASPSGAAFRREMLRLGGGRAVSFSSHVVGHRAERRRVRPRRGGSCRRSVRKPSAPPRRLPSGCVQRARTRER